MRYKITIIELRESTNEYRSDYEYDIYEVKVEGDNSIVPAVQRVVLEYIEGTSHTRKKPMTNYNERLWELLTELRSGTINFDDKAKRAITSLYKEMVAGAKPAKAIISDGEMGIDRARKSSANHAIDQFEQNLLKALEEV